jgi:thiol-disulfide isomerase/thioredoxin
MPGRPAGTDLGATLAGRKVVAMFHATWCPFCVSFAPVFRRLTAAAAAWEPLEVVLDDYDDPRWERYGIDVVPTVIFFDDGRITRRLDGQAGVGLHEAALRQALETVR